MTPNEHDLERLLRQAPRPEPPPGLRQEILREAPANRAPARQHPAPGLLQRWLNSWPLALTTACLALAAVGVVAAQQLELRQLWQQLEELRAQVASRAAAPANDGTSADPAERGTTPTGSSDDRADLERLRGETGRLQSGLAELPQLQAENARLRGELADLVQPVLGEDLQALAATRERAQRIQCVNNMKQLALAVRLYATDNNDVFPRDMLAMASELGTTKILVCPADTNRQAAASWTVFTPANCSYEYLAPGGTDEDPSLVLFRCTVHRGNVGPCDGSVHVLSEETQARRLVLQDGKLYLDGSSLPDRRGR